ncbi:hypothetical protein ACP70R_015551 [Stipagrostis hirtigluma subsp. patula]
MASSSPPPPLQPAAPPPPPPPPPSHHDTTLTLALALPPPPPPRVSGALSAKPHARVRPTPTGDAAPCTECGKRFPSWKALFGHMRCHPERQWRGITPPPPHVRYGDQFTMQEREVVDSLLMLAGARPAAAKGKKSPLGSPSSMECCGTSASPALAPPLPPVRCDDHKCSVCHRGFATGQALGGHMRCHWDRAGAVVVMFATSGGCSGLPTSVMAAATATATATDTTLDLNLPPAAAGPPLPRESHQGGSMNDTMLDLKLGH